MLEQRINCLKVFFPEKMKQDIPVKIKKPLPWYHPTVLRVYAMLGSSWNARRFMNSFAVA